MVNPKHRAPRRRRPLGTGPYVTAVVANAAGDIFELDGYAAVGRDGPRMIPLTAKNTRPMPFGGELMMLPDRQPIVFDTARGRLERLTEDPYRPGAPIFPVAAFNSPGFVNTFVSAYEETGGAGFLPLFSYGAVGWQDNGFRTAVICVDREPRQDLRRMPMEKVSAGIERMRRLMPGNRLRAHLENCATIYGCPAGKNFFLGRYEAPLPTSRSCNARCLGCISLQNETGIPHSQNRIAFTPTAEEIAEVALPHIERVSRAVVSFGQGCEGDPLLAADVIEDAIRRIRRHESAGTINMNTNASLPDALDRLFDAGLDSIRVSLNSVQASCYNAYFRPAGFQFADVCTSIDRALARNRHVAINYLNCPGFTDTPEEAAALEAFLTHHPIRMIQWRNLNFDPFRYTRRMAEASPQTPPIGIAVLLKRIRNGFPGVTFGYFNPPKEKW